MKSKEEKIYGLIVFIILIVCFIYKTSIVDDIKKVSGDVSNVTTTTKKVVVDGELEVQFIDVGQADSILISTGSHNMLIDAGNNEDGKKLVNYIKSLGINSFDYVVGTHPHEDHIGGMDDIIKSFDIKEYMMPEKLSTSKTFEDVLDALLEKELSYTVPKIDSEYFLGDALIKVIYVGDETNDANDSSIVLKLIYGDNSFLFMADASSSVERKILNSDITSDVLKVGHHGSEYSTKEEFLNKVNPKYAVISVGTNNIYKHPKQITLNKLNKNNIKIYRTDLDGTIIFNSNGKTIEIKTIETDTNG